MSRLIVKGLPSKCTEEKLRSHFKEFGEITDCSLKYTKDGKFRRFAFIGFENEESAKKAREYLHNTFICSSRIQVEECRPFGDETKPRAWSKYAKESSAYKRLHPDQESTSSTSISSTKAKTPPSKKRKNNQENECIDLAAIQKDTLPLEMVSNNDESYKNLTLELMSGITGDTSLSLIISGLPKTVKAKGIKDWFSPLKVKGLKIVRGPTGAVAFATFFQPSAVREALERSGQFLGGSKLEIKKVPSHHISEKETEDYVHDSREMEVKAAVATILETGRLFIRNLPYTCTDDDLRYLFKKYGEISDLQTVVDKKTGRCKGFAIITFLFPESAVAAFSALDGSIFKGRMLHILPGEEKREERDETGIYGKSAFQKAKLAKLKKDAGKVHSWNTLFLGPNAVAETLAEKLLVGKSDLLLGEGEASAGVRLALAETRLVRETRDYLLASGVCLDSFSRPATKRSDTVIIVKNLPAHSDIEELQRMFERYGPVKKTLLPPGCVSALVMMENAIDASKAFKALAYVKFRSQPLYLEWAPYSVFELDKSGERQNSDVQDDRHIPQNVENENVELTTEDKKKLRRSRRHRLKEAAAENAEQAPNHVVEKEEEDKNEKKETCTSELIKPQNVANTEVGENENSSSDEQNELLPGTTLFVKNLSFKTTEEELKKKFQSRFRIRSATISTKRDIKDPTKTLSMGFGFITFFQPEDAQQALKEMQGISLDGHSLELKLSHREIALNSTVERKRVGMLEQGEATKILVRNIPFQATRKEVKQLFSTFGEIRSFRMPKKIGGSAESHRGFGFVDYLTRADARRAFKALVHSTHFYGRRLVLEWAKSDDDLEKLWQKAATTVIDNKKKARLEKKMMKKIEKDLTVIDDD